MRRYAEQGVLAWFFLVAAAMLVGSAWLALVSPNEGHDSYLFLLQSRRLTDPEFAQIPFIATRPRFFVALLAGFEWLWHGITGAFPDLASYHVFATSLNFAAVLSVAAAGIVFLGVRGGSLLGALFASHYLLIQNAALTLADGTSAGLVALTCLAYGLALRRIDEGDDTASTRWAVCLGGVGALLAATKYQLFFFLPALLGAHAVALLLALPGRLKEPKALRRQAYFAGIAALAFIAGVELCQRLFGEWREGFFFTLRLHSQYLHLVKDTVGQPRSPMSLYAADLARAYGWPAIVLMLASSAFLAGRIAARPEGRYHAERVPIAALAVTATHLLFWVFLHYIRHKETRYALPLIPGFLALGTAALLAVQRRLPPRIWPLAPLCWALIFAQPLWTSGKELERQLVAASRVDRAELSRFTAFLGQGVSRCRFIAACETMVEREKLDYPFYQFHFPWARVEAVRCPAGASPRVEIPIGPSGEPGTCLVVPRAENEGVVVEKWEATRLTAKEASEIALRSGTECRAEGERHGCLRVARFFGRAGAERRLSKAPEAIEREEGREP